MVFRLFLFLILFAFPVLAEDGKVLGIYFAPGSDCEKQMIDRIHRAKKIDIAVYAINNDAIVDAVLKAHENGTKIHIVTDRIQAKGKWSKVNDIKDSGIPLRINRRHKIEHNKFAVFDNEVVVTGSYNWTNPATDKNSENCIFFTDPKGKFSKRFQYLWDFYRPE